MRCDKWDLEVMSKIDAIICKLSMPAIGQILRGSEYNEEVQNMDKDQELAAFEQANFQTEAHQD